MPPCLLDPRFASPSLPVNWVVTLAVYSWMIESLAKVSPDDMEHGHKLSREFYARSVLIVARQCIGKLLVHRTVEGETAGRIVEAEAYRGPLDLAAHSARGHTKRKIGRASCRERV